MAASYVAVQSRRSYRSVIGSYIHGAAEKGPAYTVRLIGWTGLLLVLLQLLGISLFFAIVVVSAKSGELRFVRYA